MPNNFRYVVDTIGRQEEPPPSQPSREWLEGTCGLPYKWIKRVSHVDLTVTGLLDENIRSMLPPHRLRYFQAEGFLD